MSGFSKAQMSAFPQDNPITTNGFGNLLITANQPFSGWNDVFPDPSMTVAGGSAP